MSQNENTEVVAYEKGSWQDSLNQSTVLLDRSAKQKKRASTLLWTGAREAIDLWLPNADEDVSAEGLYEEVLDVLGTSRKGDASKIKTVALAVSRHGLVLATYPNLSQAYAEAARLTKTVAIEAAEDDAAEAAIEALADSVPNSTTTPEGAALILLSKGVDGAVVAILDALNGPSGEPNPAAHRAFMRAVATEAAARVQAAKPKPAPKAEPKEGVEKATSGAKSTAKPVVAKAKAKPGAKATPGTKAKPAVKAVEPEVEDMFDEVDEVDGVEGPVAETAVAVKAKPVRRAVPVRRARS